MRTGLFKPDAALGSVTEFQSVDAKEFMGSLNAFARIHGMRDFATWSKVWEYPWLWMHGLSDLDWAGLRVVDIGSEISPMPWYLAGKGASVHIVETDPRFTRRWEHWKAKLEVDVDWSIVQSESLPFSDETIDVLTSYSVIEHQNDKTLAIDEAVRVLKPGGVFAVSFDICEPELGMTYPARYGRAMTLREFETYVWRHPAFSNRQEVVWNLDDVSGFVQWHRQGNPMHNYTVAAAIIRKRVTLVSHRAAQSQRLWLIP